MREIWRKSLNTRFPVLESSSNTSDAVDDLLEYLSRKQSFSFSRFVFFSLDSASFEVFSRKKEKEETIAKILFPGRFGQTRENPGDYVLSLAPKATNLFCRCSGYDTPLLCVGRTSAGLFWIWGRQSYCTPRSNEP